MFSHVRPNVRDPLCLFISVRRKKKKLSGIWNMNIRHYKGYIYFMKLRYRYTIMQLQANSVPCWASNVIMHEKAPIHDICTITYLIIFTITAEG